MGKQLKSAGDWFNVAAELALKIEKLETENERLREMVARYADIGACLDTGQNGKLMSLSQGGPLVADAIETPMCSTLCAKGEPCMIAPKCPNVATPE